MPGTYPAFVELDGELTEDLVIVADRSLDALWEFTTAAGVAEPLTGLVNVIIQVNDPDDVSVLKFTVADGDLELDAAAGTIEWNTDPDKTADVPAGEYSYDMIFVWSDGKVTQEAGPASFTVKQGEAVAP